MALFSRKEFATKWGVSSGNLTNYINRKKIIVNRKDQIDDSVEKNREWIENRKAFLIRKAAKAGEPAPSFDDPVPKKAPSRTKTKKDDAPPEPPMDFTSFETLFDEKDIDDVELADMTGLSLSDLQKLKTVVEIKQKESATKLNQIRLDKQQGELIPTELMKPIILQFSKAMSHGFKNAADEIIVEISHKKKMSASMTADLRKRLTELVNETIKTAVSTARKSAKNVAENFSETRSRGEKRQ